MINHQNKFVFIHIPKTGGTALSEILLEGGASSIEPNEEYKIGHRKNQTLCHMTYKELYEDLNINLQDYYKFTIVRNPWDRAVSLWAYRFKKKGISFVRYLHYVENKDLKILDKIFINYHIGQAMIRPQSDYVLINGEIKLDKIYRFENYEEEINSLREKLNIKKEIVKINSSTHEHYSEYYNKKTIRQIERIYSQDIELFNYKFEKA